MSKSLRTRKSTGLFSVLSRGGSLRTRRSEIDGPIDLQAPWGTNQGLSGARRRSVVDEDDEDSGHEFEDLSRVTSIQSYQSHRGWPQEEPHAVPVDDGEPSDNSLYPEVRAAVSPIDNVDLSINTPRMWILSLLFAIIGSATNMFFSLRYPSVTITPVIALLLVHPLGLLWDQLLKRSRDPQETFVDGRLQPAADLDQASHWTRWRRWFAQGHWNEKEHACVYISSNVAFGFAFATDVSV